MKKLLMSEEVDSYFFEHDYDYIAPQSVVNSKNDTIFITAGIQSLLQKYNDDKLECGIKYYISQPVIRTQFIDTLGEGTSLAFVNLTTAGFNISESDYNLQVEECLELFYQCGMDKSNFFKKNIDYERIWGDSLVRGKSTFYYYNDIEIGDTTFFNEIKGKNKKKIETMCDIGFGLERVRWCLNRNNSYYDIFCSSDNLTADVKALLSVLALLAVNEIRPSNKNSGYRVRHFSKKLVNLLEAKKFSTAEMNYLRECIIYWENWQKKSSTNCISEIENEYIRNGNRYILDKLQEEEGYLNLSGIKINITREELEKRLKSSSVDEIKIKKYIKKE